ncbi:MAG: hypothetical protein QOE14_2456 [Humisphaera sp.]|nr:hypothetical protein [Humisphaera sp.]
MSNAIKKFPWFEVILVIGLAIALIIKPQTAALSATSESGVAGSSTSSAAH